MLGFDELGGWRYEDDSGSDDVENKNGVIERRLHEFPRTTTRVVRSRDRTCRRPFRRDLVHRSAKCNEPCTLSDRGVRRIVLQYHNSGAEAHGANMPFIVTDPETMNCLNGMATA